MTCHFHHGLSRQDRPFLSAILAWNLGDGLVSDFCQPSLKPQRRISAGLEADVDAVMQAFYMVGDIKEVEEKADKLAKEMAASEK